MEGLCPIWWRIFSYFVFVLNKQEAETNSPASLLVNFPLFSFGVRYFYQLRGVSVSPLSVRVPASLLLSAFSLQINQTTKIFVYK